MAYVLSIMPHSPLASPYQERQYERSWSSLGSTGTIQRHRTRQHSVGSLASTVSIRASSWRSSGNRTPIRSSSYSDLVAGRTVSCQRTIITPPQKLGLRAVVEGPSTAAQGCSLGTPALPAGEHGSTFVRKDTVTLDLVDEEETDAAEEVEVDESASWHTTIESTMPIDIITNFSRDMNHNSRSSPRHEDRPFRRWLSTLRRRKAKRCTHAGALFGTTLASSPPSSLTHEQSVRHHRKSESWASSLEFVAAVKSASITLASFSVGPLSRSGTRRSDRSRLLRESGESGYRKSIAGGAQSPRSIIDEAAWQRSRKRREKLEELIRSEESYVADLKALSNAYFTLLPPLPSNTAHSRTSARSNIANMIQLHDEIFSELHKVIPFPECDSTTGSEQVSSARPVHTRWHSDDGAMLHRLYQDFSHTGWSKRKSLDVKAATGQESFLHVCTPETVSDVARVFAKNMRRFTLYEEYGARCEMMQEDIDFFQRTSFSGPDFDKAIEALCATLNPLNTRDANQRKALSIKDLLIKPIQRITRYELLFKDLCRFTPSCDDPSSHLVLDDILRRLSEICRNVNEAKDNPERLRLLESSWLLQDRLFFKDKISRSMLFQRLGRLCLCGTLYVAYRTRNQIQGRYMICVLYDSFLMLAITEDVNRYNVLIAAPLVTASLEETDNGKGLQCHTAPYTWKLVFESAGGMFELVFAACSAAEEIAWRYQISNRIATETKQLADCQVAPPEMMSPLTSELRSIGKAYGKPGGFVRRLSVHRSATLGPMSDANQVIIMQTQAPKDDSTNSSTSSLPIPRSASVMTPSHVPTLAPMRQERIKLETLLADVWTKDSIPYPGMRTRRAEHSIRDTANDLIRKLSMASIASNFSKRSMSYTSGNAMYQANIKPLKMKAGSETVKLKRPPLIDFHNAPSAFLPEDFELQDPRPQRPRGLGLRTLTMTSTDRSRSPFFFSQENKVPEMNRSQSMLQHGDGVPEVTRSCDNSNGSTVRGDGVVSSQTSLENREPQRGVELSGLGGVRKQKAKLKKLLGRV